jgi:glycosyltransferase involved in cell wall biosynthesis
MANSKNVQRRIRKFYRRDSEVIYPPVEVEKYSIGTHIDDYYICLSRLVPYKKIDIAVRAFNKMGKKLVVIGDGNHMGHLKRIAESNIEFLGFVDGQEKNILKLL